MNKKDELFKIQNLKISVDNSKIIDDLNFTIQKNEILAIVGESGSGKTITALSLLGLLSKKFNCSGSISFEDISLLDIKEKDWLKIRGKQIGIVFQEPQSSLNPSMKCGQQIKEVLDIHSNKKKSQNESKKIILKQLLRVKLKDPDRIFNSYPHEISGGQKQRVMIAMALICNPKILIADEPTTALDVIVQKEIIDLIKELQVLTSMSVLFISHDLSLVSELANKIIVLRDGKIIEKGYTDKVLNNPKNNYTKDLINSKPPINYRLEKLPTIDNGSSRIYKKIIIPHEKRIKNQIKIYSKIPILKAEGIYKKFIEKKSFLNKSKYFEALKNINFKLYPGETLGILGPSGSGKSTLGKTLNFLDPPTSGRVFFNNKAINENKKNDLKNLRKNIQLVFQDPYSALHPKKTIGNILIETIDHYENNNLEKNISIAKKLLVQVGLPHDFFNRYSFQLSGGQRQRVVIARALAVKPKILIFDESVAALDISIQAKILNLLAELRTKLELSYIFISHDISVVKYISDKIIVMDKGQIKEYEESDNLYKNPKSSITKQLVNSIPGIEYRKLR